VFRATSQQDAVWSLLAVAFVFSCLWYHLKSVFLSFIGVLLIILSFPLTAVISNGIFGVSYFSNIHILAIFIVLGVAADDVFVFSDAWR
jgi:protein dispatched 1